MNRYYIENLRDFRINSIQIKIASPEAIINWGSRFTPVGDIVGEIKTSQTINYKTLKPERAGLFCERIFGPINDFQCACGKKYEDELAGFCPQCKIEFQSSRVRRYRLGYIKLLSPVVHIWYIRYISILLDIPLKSINSIIYCTDDVMIKRITRKRQIVIDFVDRNTFLITDLINNNIFSRLIKLKYSLHIQKNLLLYLTGLKKSLFISRISFRKKKRSPFEYLYFILNNFYSLSYSFRWEATDQWNVITWYLRYKERKDKVSRQITPFFREIDKTYIQKYEDKLLFGTRVIYNWLRFFDYNFQLANLERQMRFFLFEIKEEIKELSGIVCIGFFKLENSFSFRRRVNKLTQQKNRIIRRLRLIKYFRQAKIQPRWMILSVLPVLPPDLRPIVELGSNKIAVSDLNKSYQTILLRGIRLDKFYNNRALDDFTEEVRYTKRLLQESVDELIQQDKYKRTDTKTAKSLSDSLKGKRGRFRQNLLGKRVDYSGRSVIIVDPTLRLHECGLPLKIVIELFSPFLIQHILSSDFAKTIPRAQKLIEFGGKDFLTSVHCILNEHLILLNRAPTLHKLGIQAFQPRLVKGKAIRLHPLVCPAFNADFDGDQMGIHVPLFFEARAESWKLLWSRNNLLFSATGMPVLTPGQDMILGCYYLTSLVEGLFPEFYKTTLLNKKVKKKILYFKTMNDVLKAYNQEKITIHTEIWVRWNFDILDDEDCSHPNEIRIYKNGNFCLKYTNLEFFYNMYGYKTSQFLKTTVGRIIFNHLFKLISN